MYIYVYIYVYIIIYTLFGINAPEGANKTLITLKTHTHLFSAAPYWLGQGIWQCYAEILLCCPITIGHSDDVQESNTTQLNPVSKVETLHKCGCVIILLF